MEYKIKPIVLGTIEADNSTLRLKTIADIMSPVMDPVMMDGPRHSCNRVSSCGDDFISP